MPGCPRSTPLQDGVRQQLAALGSEHVGYAAMPLPRHGYSVVGARPFSKARSDRGLLDLLASAALAPSALACFAAAQLGVVSITRAHTVLAAQGLRPNAPPSPHLNHHAATSLALQGGRSFSSIKPFLTALYGVASMEESAERIVQVRVKTRSQGLIRRV